MSMSSHTIGKTLVLIVSPFLKWSSRISSIFLLQGIALLSPLLVAQGLATNYYVEDATQFNSLVDKNGANFSTLRAGDRVYLKAGNWGGLVATITGSMTDADAQSNPAMILASDENYIPKAGGVIVDGLSQINLSGTGISFYGVTFSSLSGMLKVGSYNDYGGNDSVAYLIRFAPGSRYMTVSHLKFDYCGRDTLDYANNDHYGAWLFVYGYRHTIQYCEMAGRDFWPSDFNETDPTKRKSIRQATVTIYKDSADTNFGYHNIHHNFFGERKIPLSSDPRLPVCADGTPGDPNGWETIRCGNSSFVNEDFNNTIEKNVFYHSIWAVDGGANDQTGEPEMISNKSRKNIYKYNTILNNYGTLTLRQGDYCTVQGNYFLAGGSYDSSGAIVLTESRNTRMGGVRAFGFGHTIANNYFYRLNSDGIRSALILGSGGTETGSLSALINGSNGAAYETANYAQIFGNSFIDCKVITLDNPNNETYPVYGTQFFNNLIAYSSDIGGSGVIGNPSVNYGSPLLRDHGGRAAGNYVYSATSSQLGSAGALLGSMWMSETFVGYTNSQTLTNTLSPTLITTSGNPTYYTKITNDGGNNVAQYQKTTTNNGSQVMFAFSPTNTMTARTNGYVSFKIKQNIDTSIPTANAFDVGIGNNVSATTTSSSANRLIGISFKQSGTTTNTLVVSSAGTSIGSTFTNTNSTAFSKVEIWFNDSDTASMAYTDPSGSTQNLSTNSFVIYLGGVLVTPSASGSALTGAGGTSLNIGKIGFSTASTGTINFSIDDILAGDANNTISSASGDNPLISGTYDVLTVPSANSPLLGKASALPIINDTSTTGSTYNLAGTVATYGALDMRGLGRPSTGRDIGNYEVEATGAGNRPLRRMEVGLVAATYPSAILINSITQGFPFSQQLSASFGTGTLSWSSTGTLPAGLSLTPGGLLSGTASGGGTYPVTIRVTDANGSYAEIFTSLTVVAPLAAPVISSLDSATGAKGTAFSYTITASGSPASYDATPLPAGLNINTSTGAITGTPTVGGTFSITLSATNAGGSGTKVLALTISDEFDALRLKWRDSLIAAGGTIDSNAIKYWTGSSPINASPATSFSSSTFYLWSDLPLNTSVSGNMRDTFDRLEKMALAYANPSSIYYQNATLAADVIKGLNWMVANVYNGTNIYDNWYHWMISGAENFANAALLVYPALTESQITSYYTKLQYYSPSGGSNGQSLWPGAYNWSALTGSNIAEAAFVMTLNGILNKSSVKLTEGRTNLLRVFPTVTSGDGFYSDGGYIFHGSAVENGSYGLALIVAVTDVTKLLYGSAWALAESDSSKVYSAWIPQGLMPFYYHGALMHMIRGRSYTTSTSTESKAGDDGITAMQGVANWSFIPETEKGKLTAFANTPHPAVGQYMFPSIDRVVAHRSNFSIGLSLSSSRTCNWDPMRNTPSTQNNDKGWNTADGMTSLYLGSEDTQFTGNIWPTMDWFHMTGTTAEQNYQAQPGTPSEDWAGGAEVSGYGVAGMSLHPVGSSAIVPSTLYGKKSYFMLEKEVVCLGAGITAGSANEIHTTVENRRMGSGTTSVNLWVDGVATSRLLNWGATLGSPKSCAIEGVGGYYFPDGPNNIRAEFVPSSGTWTGIHPYDSDTATYTDNYLRLIFNHGARPSGATYAYTLLPTMTPSEVAGYAYNPQTTILNNTDTVQAVKNPTLGVVAANFWNSAGGTIDLLTVNKSCAVITRETYDSISVGLSDPSQTLTGPGGVITVTLNRTGTFLSKDSEVTIVRTTPTIQFTANVSGARGKTIHATFTLSPAPQITSNLNLVGVTGLPVSYQIASNASGVTYGAPVLPRGLSLNTTTGAITGTPTESGTYTATVSATNGSGRTGYATLTIQVGANLSNLSSTFGASTTWVCPANVTAVQVEAWGAGGAGGSGVRGTSKAAMGGGGAGGAYAKVTNYPVISGRTYYLNIGAGGISSTNDLASVAGGDSWFNSNNVTSTLVLAKGGAGGQSVVTTTNDVYGTGGTGTTNGSIGNVLFAGGNGATSTTNGFGGGGGGSGGILSAGNAPASTTNGLGAIAVAGGGNGGNANPTNNSSANGQSPTGSPGGGGGGARSASTAQKTGGTGAAGQVILTVQSIAKASQEITFGLDSATAEVGDIARTLIATSSSGLTVTLTSLNPNVATITSGNTLNIVGVGTTTITAKQAGNSNYEAATDVSVVLTVSAASGTTYASYLSDNNLPAGTAFDAKVNGVAVGLKYAFGSASGMPQNNGEAAVPVMSGNQLTYTFDVKDDSPPLTVTYQTSTDLVTWTTAQDVSPGAGAAPAGFLKRQVVVTGSDKLFVRINVTR
jgi:hyaluronate lyase